MVARNIIFITVDCLRADFLELDSRFDFEIFQRLFNEGIWFTNMISVGPNTPLAFSGLFSSSYPSMWGGYLYLGQERATLAEVLKSQDIETAGIHSNPHLISIYGYNRGFDYFYDYTQSQRGKITKLAGDFRRRYKEKYKRSKFLKSIIDRISENKLLNILVQKFISQSPYEEVDIMNVKAMKWLEKRDKRKRFFLWVHYMEPHVPYMVNEEIKKFLPVDIDHWSGARLVLKARENPDSLSALEKETIKLLYLSQIKYLELKMDEFLNYLFNNSLMEETLLIFSADHGTELLEHGVFGHAPIWYKENEIKLFNTVLKIPFLIYGRKIDGKRNENLASSIDIAPTICALLGIKSPENWLGQNLLASDFKREMVISEQIYFEEDKIQGAFAFQTQDEKFIYNLSRGIYYYYDLKKDPEEMENCMDIHPQKRKEIERCYLSHNRLILDTYQKPETSIMVDSEIKRRLESLGYL